MTFGQPLKYPTFGWPKKYQLLVDLRNIEFLAKLRYIHPKLSHLLILLFLPQLKDPATTIYHSYASSFPSLLNCLPLPTKPSCHNPSPPQDDPTDSLSSSPIYLFTFTSSRCSYSPGRRDRGILSSFFLSFSSAPSTSSTSSWPSWPWAMTSCRRRRRRRRRRPCSRRRPWGWVPPPTPLLQPLFWAALTYYNVPNCAQVDQPYLCFDSVCDVSTVFPSSLLSVPLIQETNYFKILKHSSGKHGCDIFNWNYQLNTSRHIRINSCWFINYFRKTET